MAQLDEEHKDAEKSMEYVGKFLLKVPEENSFIAMRSQIGLDNIKKYDMVDHKHWAPIIERINSAFE